MENRLVIAFVVAVSVALGGVAYAGDALLNPCVPVNAETVKLFRQNTVTLRDQLSAKELEQRHEYGYEGFNMRRVDELEGEIRTIKEKIKSVARDLKIEPGSCYQL
ncbi:hypothetical protein KI809_02190 [Geobacter pelophilus]|uniref:Uncharacterized protein n=1 Tax=Geoanaerobacter pelophilus TaxID=60036 RepID=A0AAW4L288_9BACT|nr:hypothetical protein [Geoanaerobacter pelophilus]MBT0663098.1 hypothetical protein [Geoanaerobacter pelophilus]